MKKFILEYLWCFYLGAGIALLGYDVLTWQFWAYIVPVIILDRVSRHAENEL